MAHSLAQARHILGVIFRVAARRTQRFVTSAASSPWLQQTVLATALLAIAGVILYIPAVLGYLFLYYKYLPELVTTVPVHLQYGVGPNPFGIASLEGIANRQPYDITVSLVLPRSPANLDRGNFMIALHLLSPAPTAGLSTPRTSKPLVLPYLPPAIPHSRESSSSAAGASSWHSLDTLLQPTRLDLPSFLASNTIVHTAARPALVPYVDPLASQATRFFLLFYHMLSPRTASTVRLEVPMAEDLSFSSQRRRGASSSQQQLPESLLLEVQAGQGFQVYEARVTLAARLKGLRGFMYRWKVTAFVVATGAFWAGEMMILACAVVAVGVGLGERWEGVKREDDYDFERMSSGEEDDGKGAGRHKRRERARDGERRVKAEVAPSSASDGKEMAKKTIKKEEVAEREILAKVPPLETGQSTEADDEAELEPEGSKKWKGKVKEVKLEDGNELQDAGIGTSYNDQTSKEGVRRRKNIPS